MEVDLALLHQLAHLVDAVLGGAEAVAVMNQSQRLGERGEVERPVERAVATAGDQDVLVLELLHLAHGIEDGLAFIAIDAGDRRALGHEAAAAGGDHHGMGDDLGLGIGRQLPAAVVELLERAGHLVEMELGAEGLDLLHQPVGQFLAGDDGQAGNVVDRLLRIQLGALPARPVEDVDQMAFEVQQTQLEHREQSDGARADDCDVRLDGSAHSLFHTFG